MALSAQVLMAALGMTSMPLTVQKLLPQFHPPAATAGLLAAYLLLGVAVPMACVWMFERSSRRTYLRQQLALAVSSAVEQPR